MRTLLNAPDSAIDPSTHAARFGSYRGGIPRVDLGPLAPRRRDALLRNKRWVYVAMATEDVFVALAVVHLGYAANLFALALDARAKRLLFDKSMLGPPFACRVGDTAGAGCTASFRVGRTHVSITRPRSRSTYDVDARFGTLRLRAKLDAASAPPPLTAIAPIPGGIVNVTEKRALLEAEGELTVGRERRSLDGGLAGYDYTNGLLARRTAWRWAFLLGRAKSGEKVGVNLVEGFVGEAECGVWVDGELHPLAEGRFDWNERDPLTPWHVTTADGSTDLRFVPGAVHAEKKNLGVIASRFIQPVGTYTGTIAIPGRAPLVIDRALGVTEDQDVKW
jgi:hypothetical protein